MHVVRNIETREVLHIDYTDSEKALPPEQVYEEFDSSKMELGWTDKQYIPGYFSIDESGLIIELAIGEAVEQGLYKLEPEQRLKNGEITEMTKEELVNEGLSTIDKLKEEMIEYFSQLSFGKRRELIPDYKLENAAIGVYDKQRLSEYKATIQAFRDEFHRLAALIKKAKSAKYLEKITPNYPESIISETRSDDKE